MGGTVLSAANPDWAPDGRTIVAEVETAAGAGVSVMAPDGSNVRNLTPKGFQGQPSFSPDGKWIVFERDPAPGDNGVWLMRADGSGLRRLTRNPFMTAGGECGCDTDPNFAPSGRLITFVRVKEDERLQALFVVRPNGTGLERDAVRLGRRDQARLVAGRPANPSDGQRGLPARPVREHGHDRPDGTGRVDVTRFTGGKSAFAGWSRPTGLRSCFGSRRKGGTALPLSTATDGTLARSRPGLSRNGRSTGARQ